MQPVLIPKTLDNGTFSSSNIDAKGASVHLYGTQGDVIITHGLLS